MPLGTDPYRNELTLRAIARANAEREIPPAAGQPITLAEYNRLMRAVEENREATLMMVRAMGRLVGIYEHLAEQLTGRPVEYANEPNGED